MHELCQKLRISRFLCLKIMPESCKNYAYPDIYYLKKVCTNYVKIMHIQIFMLKKLCMNYAKITHIQIFKFKKIMHPDFYA